MLSSRPKQRNKHKQQGNANLNNILYNALLPNINEIEYFLLGPKKESDKKGSTEITKLQKETENVFTSIGCFDGIFSVQLVRE